MEVTAKKVQLIELFYDLIYVYAISNLTLLVEEPEGGIVTWEMFAVYLIFTMVIIQAWLLMTNYVNHCCSWRWYDYVLVVMNMAAVVLMTQTINNDPDTSALPLFEALIVMTGTVIVLYLIKYTEGGKHRTYAKNNLAVLFLIEIVYIIALALKLTGYEEISKYIIVLNLIIGMIAPLLNRADDPSIGNFPHLVERLELLTIIMFGEAIIAITGFFDLLHPEPLSVMNFMVIILMFASYVCQIHYMCDHHKIVRANNMILCHYVIFLSINLVTVAFIYSDQGEVDTMITASLMAVSMIAYNLAVHMTCRYFRKEMAWKPIDMVMMLLFSAIGATIMLAFNDSQYALSIGALFGFGMNFAYSWLKYQKALKTMGAVPVEH